MNEVTRIHLGRQQFNVSVDAHQALKTYLAAIKKQVGDQSVVDEVEARMAEILLENGVTGEKVILASDVDLIKKQLGDPKDFKDEDTDDESKDDEPSVKRFYLDPEHGMIAGVSAGLSNYFGIDVKIVRIIFVIGAITGGWAILLYIALWLLVPPARTASEKLQMQGKPINVNNLKEAVERADIQAAAHRAQTTFSPIATKVLNIIRKTLGVSFILAGLAVLLSLVSGKVYMLSHSDKIIQENIFPVGASEHLLLNIALILVGIIATLTVLSGMAMFKKAWPVRGWITGVLLGIFFIGAASAAALAADAGPKIRSRYNSYSHSSARAMDPFNSVSVVSDKAEIRYEQSSVFAVKISYFGNPDISKVTTEVVGTQLQINTKALDSDSHCDMLCLFPSYNVVITVYSPQGRSIDTPAAPDIHLLPSSI